MENKLYCCKWKSIKSYYYTNLNLYFYKYKMPQSHTLAGQMATNMDYSSVKQHEENVQKQKYVDEKLGYPWWKGIKTLIERFQAKASLFRTRCMPF